MHKITTTKSTEDKKMSNKKASPVRWLDVMIGKMEQHGADLPALRFHIDKALQMESQKQQKYDEMVAMLESCVLAFEQMGMKEPVGITQLIKKETEI